MTRRTLAEAILSVPILAACGTTGPTRSSEARASQSLAPVTLQFWTNNTANVAYAKEFEARHPNVKMDAASIGDYDVLAEKGLTNVAAGTPPNISILGQRHGITQLSDGGALRDVETLLTKQERADFYPQFIEKFTYKGALRALPFQSSVSTLYWNKEHFQAVGLDPETPPATWDEHLDMARKLVKHQPGGQTTQWGHAMVSGAWYFYAMVWQNGGEVVDKQGQPAFNKQPGIEAAQLWQDWVHRYRIAPGGKRDEAAREFRAGRVSLMQQTQVGRVNLDKEGTVRYGVAFLPKKQRYAVSIGGNAIGIFKAPVPAGKNGRDLENASWEFVNWVTGTEMGARIVEETGYLPLRRSTTQTEKLRAFFKASPHAEVPVQQLQHLQPHPIQRADEQMWVGLDRLLTTLETDATANPRPLLDALAAEIRQLLSR